MRILSFLLLTTLFTFSACSQTAKYKTGDIIFQGNDKGQGAAVKKATNSKFSHVGMIWYKNEKAYVLEAVEPVKITPLNKWIAQGDNEYYEVLSPKTPLPYSTKIESKIDSLASIYLTKHYDIYFGWDDDVLYCSELVWKLYKEVYGIELSKLRKMESFNLEDPIVKKILKQRYGNHIPLKQWVVAPEDIYQSELLKRIK